jgi:N-carbamoyl-L-amino-acid hydrolase
MGSGVFAGAFTLEHARAQCDLDGKSVGDELRRIGYAGAAPVGRLFGAYFEAHIEQGPVLEDTGNTIGVVTGALGLRWYDVTVTGQDAHAGPTPMRLRKDALLGAAQIVGEVKRIAIAHHPDGRGTVGFMQVKPNSRNVVPGEVRFSVDLRHADALALDAMEAELRASCERIGRDLGLAFVVDKVTDYPPLRFDPGCVGLVREAAHDLGLRHIDIVSGAGHDACYVARVAPVGMIFVPCEGGISHNEIENARPEDLAFGCQVLLRAAMRKLGIGVSSLSLRDTLAKPGVPGQRDRG